MNGWGVEEERKEEKNTERERGYTILQNIIQSPWKPGNEEGEEPISWWVWGALSVGVWQGSEMEMFRIQLFYKVKFFR